MIKLEIIAAVIVIGFLIFNSGVFTTGEILNDPSSCSVNYNANAVTINCASGYASTNVRDPSFTFSAPLTFTSTQEDCDAFKGSFTPLGLTGTCSVTNDMARITSVETDKYRISSFRQANIVGQCTSPSNCGCSGDGCKFSKLCAASGMSIACDVGSVTQGGSHSGSVSYQIILTKTNIDAPQSGAEPPVGSEPPVGTTANVSLWDQIIAWFKDLFTSIGLIK